jgi:hypothetical protein
MARGVELAFAMLKVVNKNHLRQRREGIERFGEVFVFGRGVRGMLSVRLQMEGDCAKLRNKG